MNSTSLLFDLLAMNVLRFKVWFAVDKYLYDTTIEW